MRSRIGRLLRLDPDAQAADASTPAFVSRPKDAPVYYGFTVLDDVEVEGFRFGMITDFEAEPDTRGDAFVVAPDGSRCGLNWQVDREDRFEQVLPLEANRWGVWYLTFPYAMDSRDNVRRNLAHVLPRLRPKWEQWRSEFGKGSAKTGAL